MRMPQLWRARAQHAAPAAACALARKRARRQRVGSLAARAHTARTPQGTPPRLSRPTRGAAQHGGAAWPWWRWGARAAAHLGLDHCIDARPVCAFGCHCRWRRGGLPISRRARGRASTGRPCARRSCRDALRLRSCVARAPALAPALLPCDVPAGTTVPKFQTRRVKFWKPQRFAKRSGARPRAGRSPEKRGRDHRTGPQAACGASHLPGRRWRAGMRLLDGPGASAGAARHRGSIEKDKALAR